MRKAVAQRAAKEERDAARYAMSAARARMGNTADPTNVKLLADLEARGEYNALMRLWEGDEEAEGDYMEADVVRRQGKAAAFGGAVRSIATLSGTSFAEKYG